MKTTVPLLCLILFSPLLSHAAPPFAEFIDPNPNPGNQFGATVVPLSTGNVVITSPYDDAGGADAGAVYLFNGASGALISTLKGSSANDRVGSFGVHALTNGNYVIRSPDWDNGPVADAGAVTWASGATGISGAVGAGNSLVGSTAGDRVGGTDKAVTALANGNYVVSNPMWNNGAAVDAGAVTWGNGNGGISGVVGAGNSLVGSTTNDFVGNQGIQDLANGNYVVRSPNWTNGSTPRAGAVTWGSGSSGAKGAVNGGNSLVGSQFEDNVGSHNVVVLANGNYVVSSPYWNHAAAVDAGAVTWGNGNSGISGSVGSGNSLVGSSSGDELGLGASVTALANGNYVVSAGSWDNGLVTNVGAVTWANGANGVTGEINSNNSLVGVSANDRVGRRVTALSNGNYVISSPSWKNGSAASAGAVTWANGATGISGTVGIGNSLVGTAANDRVGDENRGFFGDGVKALSNSNYVVLSPLWDNGSIIDAGAVTWGSGSSGVSGVVSTSNSLVGTTSGDKISDGVLTVLTNGNYVIRSTNWDNGAVVDAGAVTWGSGAGGTIGAVTALNSLVGSSASDQVGLPAVTALANGNYVVGSHNWDHAAVVNAGAVTWGNGTSGTSGTVSAVNSLVGTKANDQVGTVTALTNGNYVVRTNNWDNGSVVDAGAATWVNGSSGTSGPVNSSNSLIGVSQGDRVGDSVIALTNGNFVVGSPGWNHGPIVDAGAVTWGSGMNGVVGPVTSSNSLIGGKAGDAIGAGGIIALSNGNFLVRSATWDNGAFVDAGSVAWGSGTSGLNESVSSGNSLVGAANNIDLQVPVIDQVNGNFFGQFLNEGGGRVRVGSLSTGLFVVPSISLLSPDSGTTAGGTNITITGLGFAGVTSIEFGGVPVAGFTILSNTSISAITGPRAAGTVNVSVTTPAGSGVGVGLYTYITGLAAAQAAFNAAGLTGDDALPTAIPFNDGVENLLKYAFNMNLAGPDAKTMAEGGNAGLPTISQAGTGAAGLLRFEFVRRKGSGLIYTPKKNTSLDPVGWTTLTDEPTVTPIGTDGLWERVIYEEPSDPALVPVCFGRVEVTIP